MMRATSAFALACGLALGLLGCGAVIRDDGLADRIYTAAMANQGQREIDLVPLIEGDWERVVVFTGEPPRAVVDEALGFHWDGYSPGMGDGWLVVAIGAGRVVSASYVPWHGADDAGGVEFWMDDDWWVDATPADGLFTVVDFTPGRALVLCRPPDCP